MAESRPGNDDSAPAVQKLCALDVGPDATVADETFVGVTFLGPMVVAPIDCEMVECSFEGPRDDPDAMLWPLPTSNTFVVGPLAFLRCRFLNCTFRGVGFAGPPNVLDAIRQVVGGH